LPKKSVEIMYGKMYTWTQAFTCTWIGIGIQTDMDKTDRDTTDKDTNGQGHK
jgi:hypothetical protein